MLTAIAMVIDIQMGSADDSGYSYADDYGIEASFTIEFGPSLIAVNVLFGPGARRRDLAMHDVDKSGWFILVPFYNLYLPAVTGRRDPIASGRIRRRRRRRRSSPDGHCGRRPARIDSRALPLWRNW